MATTSKPGQLRFPGYNDTRNRTEPGLFEATISRNLGEHITETVILAVLFLTGVIGNSLVLRCTKRVTTFAKRNAYLIIGLSLSDLSVCVLRVPPLLYLTFQSQTGHDHVACGIWAFSHIFMFLAILTNAILALERRLIIVAFQRYMLIFTPKNVLVTNLALWGSFFAICVTVFFVSRQHAVLHETFKTCILTSWETPSGYGVTDIVNIVFIGLFGLLPILTIVFSYGSIITRIFRANLMKIDRLDEKALYTRLVYMSVARIILTLFSWPAYLLFIMALPLIPDSVPYIHYTRFLDYVVLVQSSISPFILLLDTDFREKFARRSSRFFMTIKNKTIPKTASGQTKDGKDKKPVVSSELKSWAQIDGPVNQIPE